jgi:DnaJ-class molecular chaperone
MDNNNNIKDKDKKEIFNKNNHKEYKNFTKNNIQFAPWEICLDCNVSGYIGSGTKKKSCKNCLGVGFIKNEYLASYRYKKIYKNI